MKYYALDYDLEPKVSGIRDGVDQGHLIDKSYAKTPWLRDYLYGDGAGYRAGEFPEQTPALVNIQLQKTAKLNDFVSVGGILRSFFINERVEELLSESHLPPYRLYPVTFEQKDKFVEGYKWFYFNLIDGKKWVDYEKSVFNLSSYEEEHGRKFPISSYGDMVDFANITNKFPFAKKVVFTPEFDAELDIFGLKVIGGGCFISERLKKKFEEHKITGYRTREIPYPLMEWL
jgi:hypothetical protein